jgi:hypothetical protein
MGVTLHLRLIDHERIVTRGLEVVNEAIRTGNPELLRDYLSGLPIEINPEVVEFHTLRLARLREVDAPEVVIENEVRFLQRATGEAYQPEAYRSATLDELRNLLGTWCWQSYTYDLGKLWDELFWFLEPLAGPDDHPLDPIRSSVGDQSQSPFSRALQGSVPYPVDDQGQSIIRTLGSEEPDCSGYNPPEACISILEALRSVDPATWSRHVAFRRELWQRTYPGWDEEEIIRRVETDLEMAREAFPVLLAAYTKAVERRYGISCEYDL